MNYLKKWQDANMVYPMIVIVKFVTLNWRMKMNNQTYDKLTPDERKLVVTALEFCTETDPGMEDLDKEFNGMRQLLRKFQNDPDIMIIKIADMPIGELVNIRLPYQSDNDKLQGIPPHFNLCTIVRLEDGYYHRFRGGGDGGAMTLYRNEYDKDTEIEYKEG